MVGCTLETKMKGNEKKLIIKLMSVVADLQVRLEKQGGVDSNGELFEEIMNQQ